MNRWGVVGRILTFIALSSTNWITGACAFRASYHLRKFLSSAVLVSLLAACGGEQPIDDEFLPNKGDLPNLSILEASANEGGNVVFTVVLSKPGPLDVVLSYQTKDDSAISGVDYNGASGKVTIPQGQFLAQISVATHDDLLDEANKSFFLEILSAENAILQAANGSGTILDDDNPPTLSLSSLSANEGQAAQVVVALNAPSGRQVSVDYATSAGSAQADVDYTSQSGTLTLLPGETSKIIEVDIVDDSLSEASESFIVALSNPIYATAGTMSGTVTIMDNDMGPVLSIADASVNEGGSLVFNITLSTVSGQDVQLDYTTADGTALSSGDYMSASGRVTIPAGSTSANITVSTIVDSLYETNETLQVQLSNVTAATVGDATAMGTILNDDSAPMISVADASATEGGALSFAVSLSAVSGRDVTFNYSTADDTAVAGSDYSASNGNATILAGNLSTTISIPVTSDILDENDETLVVNLSNILGASVGNSSATGSILDDDTEPSLTIADLNLTEGGVASFSVSLSAVSGRDVSFVVDTANITATAGSDYVAVIGQTVTIVAGQVGTTVAVSTVDDSAAEGDEIFEVHLSSLTNAVVGDAIAVATINDNDMCMPTDLSLYQMSSKNTVGRALALLSGSELMSIGEGDDKGTQRWLAADSVDGGVTFKLSETFAVSSNRRSLANGLGVDGSGNLYAVGVAGYRQGRADYEHWIVRKKTNGGTWSLVDTYNLTAEQNAEAKGVALSTNGTVWVVGQASNRTSHLWVTRQSTNGGASWATLDNFQLSAGQNATAYGVATSTSGAVFAVGEATGAGAGHWVVRRTLDNGSTWTTVDDYRYNGSEASGARAVSVDRNGVVYVAGFGGTTARWIVRKSVDNGTTWSVVDVYQNTSGQASSARSLYVNRLGHAVVVGSGSDGTNLTWLARETRDGGVTWTSVDSYQTVAGQSAEALSITGDGYDRYYMTGYSLNASGSKQMVVRERNCP